MKVLLTSFLLMMLLFAGCSGGSEDVRIRLTPDDRDRYQAIAAEQLDSLRPLLDSICETTFEDRVAIATDSIVQVRLEEEQRIRARIGQNEDR